MAQYKGTIIGLTLIIVSALIAGCQSTAAAPVAGLLLNEPYLIDEFTLTNQSNESMGSADFRGNLVLVYFGFINCPEECPTTLSIWKKVYTLLGEDAADIKFVMISVDPVRDTPDLLHTYLANFHSSFIGLTGSIEAIEDVATDFSVYFRNVYPEEVGGNQSDSGHEHAENYLVSHTTLTFLLDKDGNLILAFPYNTAAEEIVADLEGYLE